MKLNIITINPNFFRSPFKNGLINKAINKKKIKINFFNIIDFIKKNDSFDGKIYGGSSSLLIKPKLLYLAIKKIKTKYNNSFVIYPSPQGKIINKNLIEKILNYKSLIFICGRYSGIDQRIIDNYVDIELSIGDYILSCGEISTLVIIDILIRYIPGVLNNINSLYENSFFINSKLLSYPNYTKPKIFNNYFVPKVLLSGNHKNIKLWRLQQSFIKTLLKKPYLLNNFLLEKKKK